MGQAHTPQLPGRRSRAWEPPPRKPASLEPALRKKGRPAMRGPRASPKRSPSYSPLERCPSRNGDPAQADKQMKVNTHTHAQTTRGKKEKTKQNRNLITSKFRISFQQRMPRINRERQGKGGAVYQRQIRGSSTKGTRSS